MPETQIFVQDYSARPEKVQRTKSVSRHAPKIGNPTPLGKFMSAIIYLYNK